MRELHLTVLDSTLPDLCRYEKEITHAKRAFFRCTLLPPPARQLEGSGLAVWSRPKGGYFISLDTLAGCAKRTVQLAKEAGVTLTGAGATYPYKRDPQDRNIRIAPTYPTPEELKSAMDIFILCVKIAGIESVVNQGN